MRKKRGYKRKIGGLKRDYKLFAIACEDGKTAPEYFRVFERMSPRIAIDIIEEIVSDEEMKRLYETKSAPNWVLDRAVRYVEKEGLIDEDELWFIIDTDKWKEEQIQRLAYYCNERKNWHLALSNPCFEVWKIFHFQTDIPGPNNRCRALKRFLHEITGGSNYAEFFIPYVETAIGNARAADSDKNHYYPIYGQTKIYLLAESLLNKIGKNNFICFVEALKNKS